jgi:hypothetical protein
MAAGVSATAIALGDGQTCAIEAGGGVKCWGNNAYGQLGIGSNEWQTSPVAVPGAGRERGVPWSLLSFIYMYVCIDMYVCMPRS